ncbi:A-kinase anchor protein 14 [Lemur catta]|uniref:A-kinase anchor protein 14 n=1 Tax=Lemur catta TaxID=9447 RepID=UPI001E26CD51|nr:A-kinase anchor protein 14 [Lemur catta]
MGLKNRFQLLPPQPLSWCQDGSDCGQQKLPRAWLHAGPHTRPAAELRQKKMNVTENVKVKKKVRLNEIPIILGEIDNEDRSNVTAAARSKVTAPAKSSLRSNVTAAARSNVTAAARSKVTDTASSNVSDAARSNLTAAASSNVTAAARSKVTDTASSNVSDAASSNVTAAASSNVTAAARSKVTDTASNNVSDAARSNLTAAARSNVTDAARSNVIAVTAAASSNVTAAASSNVTAAADPKVTAVALALVKDAIDAAIKFVEEAENPIKNIKWITHGEFTAERGRKQIEQFVSKWDHQKRWVNCTKFVWRKDVIHSFHYIYCVRWSVPTAVTPTAEVSAAAYFTIKINKNKPPDAPIDVSYIFEEQSLLQRPGMARFRDKWPKDLIEAKHILIESVKSSLNVV